MSRACPEYSSGLTCIHHPPCDHVPPPRDDEPLVRVAVVGLVGESVAEPLGDRDERALRLLCVEVALRGGDVELA